jgi:hypothetical protein
MEARDVSHSVTVTVAVPERLSITLTYWVGR